jgi:hypothetical protein
MSVAYPGIYARNFFREGVQQIQLRTEGRENGDLRAVAPSQGFHSIWKMSEICIQIGLLQIYFPPIIQCLKFKFPPLPISLSFMCPLFPKKTFNGGLH